MERVYKTRFSYEPEDEENEYTHVVYSIKEYDLLMDTLNDLKKEIHYLSSPEESDEEYAIKALGYEKTEITLEELKRVCKTFVRINKERANADRELRPKKEHTGYVVLLSQMIDGIGHMTRWGLHEGMPVWKSILQTPYEISIPFREMEILVREDFKAAICEKLGLKELFPSYTDYHKSELFQNVNGDSLVNIGYKTRYRANYTKGYWEIDFIHLVPITVPPDMRPPKKRSGKK